MTLPLLNHPTTGKPDILATAVAFVVVIAGLRFALDGLNINIFGHLISIGHTDSLSYGSLLSPVLGAHGYVSTRPSQSISRVDNPDEN